jgi:hypothetical protein
LRTEIFELEKGKWEGRRRIEAFPSSKKFYLKVHSVFLKFHFVSSIFKPIFELCFLGQLVFGCVVVFGSDQCLRKLVKVLGLGYMKFRFDFVARSGFVVVKEYLWLYLSNGGFGWTS